MVLNGYYYRPHNAYRNQPNVLWYCVGRTKYQCNATLRTYKSELVAVAGQHNHGRWPQPHRADPLQCMRDVYILQLHEMFRLYGERLALSVNNTPRTNN